MTSPTVEVLEARIIELRTLIDERFRSQQEALAAAAHALTEYKISSNEWRTALNDYRITAMSREEYNAKHDALINRIDIIQHALDVLASRVEVLESISKSRVSGVTLWLMGAGIMISLMLGLVDAIIRAVK